MKKILKTIIGISTLILIQQCNSPSDPIGLTVNSILTYDTGGYCRDLALSDSTLAAAADQNGYFIYRINTNGNGLITDMDTINHENDTNPFAGDDLSAEVDFSDEGNVLFILDPLDQISIATVNSNLNLPDQTVPLYSSWNLYRSLAISSSNTHPVILYSLIKHIEADTNASYQPYSTSIVTQKCLEYVYEPDYILDCTPTAVINDLSNYLMKMSFSNPLLAISNDQLGVLVYRENENDSLVYFSSFDTPGTVETVNSNEYTVFAGLGNDQGCYIALLDQNGLVSSNLQIAEGYSVKDININFGVVAFACGNDGILLYEWAGGTNFSALGKLDSEYAYSVEIYDRNTVIAGTREGIQIINFKD